MARKDKVAEAIRQETSLIIHNKLNDPRIGFVTITSVEVADDLRNAKIYYSVLGSEEDQKKTKAALDSSLGLIRKLVAERINLKFAPEIMFKEDHSTEYSVRIDEVLNEIKSLEHPEEKEKEEKDEPKKSRRSNKKA